MVEMFSQEEKSKAFKTKKRLLALWLALLAAYIAAIAFLAGFNLYGVVVNYSRSFRAAATIGCIALTFVFFSFTLFFFSIKYRLTNNFCKMLKDAQTGETERSEAEFVKFNDDSEMKDGVNCRSMEVNVKPLKRGDITLRKVLIEGTRPLPPFRAGDKITMYCHANILMRYEADEKESS